MKSKYKKILLLISIFFVIGNIFVFRLKASDHNSDRLNFLANESRLSISKLKNESLAIMYLEKNNFDDISILQKKFDSKINELLNLIANESTHAGLYDQMTMLEESLKDFKEGVSLFKTNISNMRVSETYLTKILLKDLEVNLELVRLIRVVLYSKVESITTIEKFKEQIRMNAKELDSVEYKKLLITIDHIDQYTKHRRNVLSSLNQLLDTPIESNLDDIALLYNKYEVVLGKGLTSILKISIALNAAFSLLIFYVLMRLKSARTHNQMKSSTSATSVNEMTTIFSSFSHRVKNPMNGILGMMSLLKGTELSEEQSQYIDGIEYSSNYLSRLLHDLVEYSRLKSAEAKVNFKTTDFLKKSEQLLSPWRIKASQKGLKFIVKSSSDFPEKVFLDYDKIRMVCENLIDNAIKFTDQGSIKVTIDFNKMGEGHGKLSIIISDSGKGLDEYEVEKLVHNSNVNNNSEVDNHTGLGLAICYEMMKLMGGDLLVRKSDQGGTCMQIELQVQIDNSVSKAKSANTTSVNLEHYKILVAEDEKINQKVIYGLLSKLNQDVTIVENGRELIDEYKPNYYDLIFVDMMMPEVDGLEATRVLVDKFGENLPPIIALSGNEKDKYLNKCLEVGMVDFISKPIKKADLKNILIKYCKKGSREKVA
ncbi:response regulator [Halobacteriovorax sp. HLS]|uniref:response regulator n=1 Tax=Halobacteriovorax sp. HLS TaxID=2234000 RepID=UPI000FD7FD5C|nr:response regulator [Halobacteriovorax sp. HLS]